MSDIVQRVDRWLEILGKPFGAGRANPDNELVYLLSDARAEIKRLQDANLRMNEEVCQTLGKALGYPWFKDDQKNFPNATAADGVCVGEHVAESIAVEAAVKLTE
jgi:hypothetical protein